MNAQNGTVLGTAIGGGANGFVQTQGATRDATTVSGIDATGCTVANGVDTTATGLCASAGSVAGVNGAQSSTVANGATAYGAYAQAQQENATAVGFRAVAAYSQSFASGYQAQALASFTTAVGANALASSTNAVAVGAGASATAANSVALGANSVATDPNTVSVGSADNLRRIVNVAAGVAPTDAVNVSQLDAVRSSVSSLQRGAYGGVASAMAMPSLVPSEPGRSILAAGAATYGGYSAVAAGLTYRTGNGHWLFNLAGSVTGGGMVGGRVQAGYEF